MVYTVHGILQARILEWVVFPFSRGSSQPRDRTQVSRTAGRFFTLSHHGSARAGAAQLLSLRTLEPVRHDADTAQRKENLY